MKDAIPVELKRLPRWVCWRREQRKGSETKVPYCAEAVLKIGVTDEALASVSNPFTWTDFDTAVSVSEQFHFDGVGIVLNGDGLVGIDLDKCVDDSGIEDWALEVVHAIRSYTEFSPSRKGLRSLAYGKLPAAGNRKGRFEMYETGRYMTVTGKHIEGFPFTVERRDAEIRAVHEKFFSHTNGNGNQFRHHQVNIPASLDDHKLLAIARKARNGTKFSALFDTGIVSDYPSQSEADLALCCMLAFYTDKDADAIDRLFRQSALYRAKWDRDDYRQRTIHAAIDKTTETFKPGDAGNEKAAIHAAVQEATAEDSKQQSTENKKWHVPAYWRWLDVAQRHDWDCTPLRWTVKDLIAQGNFVIIAAETQTGKTLFGLFLSHSILHPGQLFGRLDISPVDKILYLGLEDPDRRFDARLADIEHSFPAIEPGRFIIHIAPDFTLTDDRMVQYLEEVIVAHHFNVVFVDTYQKATPGLASFDDEKQAVILHRLANLTRKHGVTVIVLDHVRKRANGTKRTDLSLDDIKGTGAKPQNADCIILIERTPDRKQVKLQSFSKDSDMNVRFLLDVSPKGSAEPKFKYAGDLEQFGTKSAERGAANRNKVLEGMTDGGWHSAPVLARTVELAASTVQTHLKKLIEEGKVEDNRADGKYKRYRRIDDLQTGDSIGDSEIGENQ